MQRLPSYHFTPPSGWLNDPNGLVYLDGEYHLFYQHHPDSLVWGPMHWGHAVSNDLVHWEHLPIALSPDELGTIFSGSAVIDRANSADFGPGAMVLIFTHATTARQVQSLAFSTDRGRSWTKHAGNPVLAPTDAPRDFRDPRVFWYAGTGGGHWVMLLAVELEIWFYRSSDLKGWTKTGVFHAGHEAGDKVWECPELLNLPVEGGPERRWVLVVSVPKGAPAGGSGTRYFVGDFDGSGFTSDGPPESARWADYGPDFYAPQAWVDAPGGRAIWLAWMNNWDYARVTPASVWRGMMSFPRELGLAHTTSGLALVQRPARELAALRAAPQSFRELVVRSGTLPLVEAGANALELRVAFRTDGATASRFGLRLHAGSDAAVTVSYDVAHATLSVDRGRAAWQPEGFAATQVVPLAPLDGLVQLQMLLDAASLELFADSGRLVLSNQIFPAPERAGVELFAEGGGVTVAELQIWEL